jgi:hypothetical protein
MRAFRLNLRSLVRRERYAGRDLFKNLFNFRRNALQTRFVWRA